MAPTRIMAALAVMLLLAEPTAAAEASMAGAHLARARAELEALHFDQALLLATQGLDQGDADPGQTAALWAVIAESHASIEQPQASADAYGRALELDPAVLLPPGASPKLRLPYDQARSRLAGERLRAAVESTFLDRLNVRTRLIVHGDAFQMAQAFELFVRQPGGFVRVPMAPTHPPEAFWTCAEPPCAVHAAIRDRAGNLLLELGRPAAPLLVAPMVAAEPTSLRREAWYARPTPYVIGASLFALAAGAATYQILSDGARLDDLERARAEHYFSEAQAVGRSRASLYPWMLAGWGAAAGLGAVAVWLW